MMPSQAFSKFGQNTGVAGPRFAGGSKPNDNPNAAFNKGGGVFGSLMPRPDPNRMTHMPVKPEMPLGQKLGMGLGMFGNAMNTGNPMLQSMMPSQGFLAQLLQQRFPNFRTGY